MQLTRADAHQSGLRRGTAKACLEAGLEAEPVRVVYALQIPGTAREPDCCLPDDRHAAKCDLTGARWQP